MNRKTQVRQNASGRVWAHHTLNLDFDKKFYLPFMNMLRNEGYYIPYWLDLHPKRECIDITHPKYLSQIPNTNTNTDTTTITDTNTDSNITNRNKRKGRKPIKPSDIDINKLDDMQYIYDMIDKENEVILDDVNESDDDSDLSMNSDGSMDPNHNNKRKSSNINAINPRKRKRRRRNATTEP